MEKPEEEISSVVALLTVSKTPDVQKAAVERYFTKDAGFNHPLVKVKPGKDSRDIILGIYQFYRNLSPRVEIEVQDAVYDPKRAKMFLHIAQRFHLFFSPLPRATARLVTELTFCQEEGLYYIKQQNDYYDPEEFINLLMPPLTVFVIWLKLIGGVLCTIGARFNQLFGFWKPRL